jgi:tetratricopeptide (TPR) repeat protein
LTLRRSLTSTINTLYKFSFTALIFIAAGCSFQNKNGFNRTMQNITAHYNILFNANEILKQKQADYALSFVDSYGNLLSVYPDTIAQTGTADKDLDAVIAKANLIINEKEQSRYLGHAYLVLGKAAYLSANYFNAAEYFNYVTRSFTDKKSLELVQEARVWKTRSLIYLNNLPEAKLTIDSALLKINPKQKITADVYAAALAYNIAMQNYAEAEAMAQKAIQYSKSKTQTIRWTFVLAQLQELNEQNTAAIANYTKIVKSNASFEMGFNANLNRIRIGDEQQGIQITRTQRLLSLLKDQNNRDFVDQIYYQIGEIYLKNKDLTNAVKYYNLSLINSKTNQNQKGLAYLRIADINFKDRSDYVSAKKYYDSTLTNLSPNYPGYITIQKKSNNLQLLVDRLQTIAREDTAQMLARLDEKPRLERIDSMVARQTLQQQVITAASTVPVVAMGNNAPTASVSKPVGNNFYFYNASAISQGFNDFKRIWGNRKLEDNWRRSNRSSSGTPVNTTNGNIPGATVSSTTGDPDALPTGVRASTPGDVNAASYRQSLLQNLPLTPELLAQSNVKIYNAYLDIANFYRDILDDKKEAIVWYLALLARFPNDPNKAAIYYSLYRLYGDTNIAALADEYKNRLIKEFPETAFAKVITDPDYSKRLDDNDALFNTAYNQIYTFYAQKKYAQAITNIDVLMQQYPQNKFAGQLAYLRAIAAGHQQNLASFQSDLQQITIKYPNDALITPLVMQHLSYIEANRAMLATQPYVLSDNDTTGFLFTPPIAYQKETPLRRNITVDNIAQVRVEPRPAQTPAPVTPAPVTAPVVKQAVVTPPVTQPTVAPPIVVVPPVKQPTVAPPVETPATQSAPVVTAPVTPPPVLVPSIFNKRDSSNYYLVVNVSTGTTDMAPSRFGIGQYNRANFISNAIKHNLRSVGADNQLIYIGPFKNMAAVKKYATDIIPLMPQIMKVTKDKYSFFIITKENLDKLASKELLDSYIDYYQKTY